MRMELQARLIFSVSSVLVTLQYKASGINFGVAHVERTQNTLEHEKPKYRQPP